MLAVGIIAVIILFLIFVVLCSVAQHLRQAAHMLTVIAKAWTVPAELPKDQERR